MTTIANIINKAFRAAGIIEVGGTPEPAEQTEALDLLQDFYLSLFGNELGEPLTNFNHGQYNFSSSLDYIFNLNKTLLEAGFVPLNTRLLLNPVEAETLYMHPNPYDGARVAIVDNSGTLSSKPLTINGNGRTIEGADSIVLNQDSLVREWFYRADLGGWVNVTDLQLDQESPLPREFDSIISTGLAIIINPRYGATIDDSMVSVFERVKRQFRARYKQIVEIPVEESLLSLPSQVFSGVLGYKGYNLLTERGSAGTTGTVSQSGGLKTIITIGTSTNTAPPNNATRYTPPAGGGTINAMWNSSSSRPDVPCPVAGTLSNLMVRLPVALASGTSWTWTLVKNGIDTALSVTIDETGTIQFDNTHTVDVAAGDTLCIKSAPSNTPNAQTVVQIAFLFTATSEQVGPMFATWPSSGTGTGYGTPQTLNSSVQAESSRRAYMPTSGTITTLSVACNVAPGGTETRSVTLMKNGVDVLTATITGSATSQIATGNILFEEGDLIQLRKDASTSAASSFTFVGMDWKPTIAGEMLVLSPGTGNFSSTDTIFQNLQGSAENDETTESNVFNPIAVNCTLKKFRVDMGVAAGAGKSRVFTIRKNGFDTSAVLTLSGTTLDGSISPNLSLAAGDLVTWKEVPQSNPAASNPISSSGVLVVA